MTLTLDREQARRLAVLGQLLAGPAPDGIPAVVERLGAVQRDPTAAVAPTEYIVLWSRLGDYDRADLDRLLYEEQELADYWVHIVPSRQLGLQRPTMLDTLWFAGRIAIVGRQGRERVWDLADRAGRPLERLAGPELAHRLVDQQLKASGIATADALGRAFDGVRARGADRALAELAAEGIAKPVAIEALPGDWYAHRDVCRAPWEPRTTLLSPFDNLIAERRRAELLLGFRFRTELLLPGRRAQRLLRDADPARRPLDRARRPAAGSALQGA